MTAIQQTIEDFSRLKVLVIGDIMLDRYLVGTVDRISPEAPVPVVQLNETINRPGGAANVAANIAALGATPYICSVVGQDAAAQTLLDLLPANDAKQSGIIRSAQRPTTQKSRIMAGKQQLIRLDKEVTRELEEQETAQLLQKIRELLDSKQIDLILFQDYNKGVLTLPLIKEVIKEAIHRNIPTAVDPKERHFFDYQQVNLFKPNLKEVSTALGQAIPVNVKALHVASTALRSRLKHQHSLITLSDKGIFIDNDEFSEILPTQARQIADVCGAGDTVFSVAALGMALSLNLRNIALLANLAAGQVCQYSGVVPVNKELLLQDLMQLPDK